MAALRTAAVDVATADAASLRKGSWLVCSSLLDGWADTTQDNIEVLPVSGGITNLLFRVAVNGRRDLPPVLLRAYGQGTDFFIDRSRELAVMAAATTAGLGAKVLGLFKNGRIEEWLEIRNLEPHEMMLPSISKAIARRLCHFHQLQVPSMPAEVELFATIQKWFSKAMSMDFADDARKLGLYQRLDLPARRQDFEDVAAVCLQLKAPVVFGHNDLLSGNVLVPAEFTSSPDPAAESPSVNFIDFEYSAPVYRGFDVGNHFNECAGFDCDWDQYPNDPQARTFAAAYLQEQNGSMPTEDQVVAFVTEAHLFSLISHAYWGVWAVLQAKWSKLDFDYLPYSHMRWDRFKATRPAAVEAALDVIRRRTV